MTTTERVTSGVAGAMGRGRGPDGSAARQRPDPGLARLQAQFAELARVTDGTAGVALVHLERGRAAYFNHGERFPVARTVKVPLAVQLLTRVERREVRLDSMVTLQPGDLPPASGTFTELFSQPGVALSVRNLAELMLRSSDDSATDVAPRTAGGGRAANARLAALAATRPTSVERVTGRGLWDSRDKPIER